MTKNNQAPPNREGNVCRQTRGSPDACPAPAPLQRLVELAKGGREEVRGIEGTEALAGRLRSLQDAVAEAKEELSAQHFLLVVALDNSIAYQLDTVAWFLNHHQLAETYESGGTTVYLFADASSSQRSVIAGS